MFAGANIERQMVDHDLGGRSRPRGRARGMAYSVIGWRHRYIPIDAKKTAKHPSSTITRKIDFTAEVVVCLRANSSSPSRARSAGNDADRDEHNECTEAQSPPAARPRRQDAEIAPFIVIHLEFKHYSFEPVETGCAIDAPTRSASSCPTTGRTKACSRSRTKRRGGGLRSLRPDGAAPRATSPSGSAPSAP